MLPAEAALTLGMTLHELATNAAKYGALSSEAGEVDVAWRRETAAAGDELVLLWQERGGPPVRPPERRSFGSELIERGIAYGLGGTARLEFPPDGLRCELRLPLAQRPDAAAEASPGPGHRSGAAGRRRRLDLQASGRWLPRRAMLYTLSLWPRLLGEPLAAPALWLAEAASALWSKCRRRDIGSADVRSACVALRQAPVTTIPLDLLLPAAIDYALTLRLPGVRLLLSGRRLRRGQSPGDRRPALRAAPRRLPRAC